MAVGLEEAQELVLEAVDEKADGDLLVGEYRVHLPLSPWVPRALERLDVRIESTIVPPVDRLGLEEVVAVRADGRIAHAQELRECRDAVEKEQYDAGDDGNPVLQEPPPHELPLGSDEHLLLVARYSPVYFDGSGHGYSTARSILIRGSRMTRRTSEIRVPTTVSTPRIRMIVDER